MPEDEGKSLYQYASNVLVDGPYLEIGSYCGKSTIYLGAAAQESKRTLFALDHHRGSEENQEGWEWHDTSLVDSSTGKIDTLPFFRQTIQKADLEDTVVALVGKSAAISTLWHTPLALLFIDGGHGHDPAHQDYEGWVPHLTEGGTLLIHDVFPDPADGGQPPFEIWTRAVESGAFTEIGVSGSLRALRRIGPGI
ncbi:MAG TPA: class I SAM-dependent methyltransferase [Acidimicrobiales bacterium]|nr:class I SAM-dependent methyltransferase [Acidimicrobiales bacterium]